jgi:cytochrome c oxidase subunit II
MSYSERYKMLPEASTSAQYIDTAFIHILWIEIVLLVIVTSAMVFFVLKYRMKKHAVPENIEGSPLLEIIWTVVPTLLVLVIFYIGWTGFDSIRTVPKTAMVIKVAARQWSWLFTYENGKQSDVLRVPVNKPVKLRLTSQDVIHGFYIPAFRIKEDCVPNMWTYLSYTANMLGEYDIFCTEYCGHGHSAMVSKVIVMEDRDFETWYSAVTAAEKEQEMPAGEKILEKYNCLYCHTTDGKTMDGPTFKGLYGSKIIVLTKGKERTVRVDEDYLRKSIQDPKADIVKGYSDIMPIVPVTPEDVGEIVEYIKKLQ